MAHESRHLVRQIISGGQTGVDRAALCAASALDIPHGGWCPRGRLAEDGVIPPEFELRETESPVYAVRTERNVIDSDATLILGRGPLTGGTALTERLAERHKKPCLVLDLEDNGNLATCRRWLVEQQPARLNIAGPRESTTPGIAEQAQAFLVRLLGEEPARD